MLIRIFIHFFILLHFTATPNAPVQNNGRYLEAGIEDDHQFERWFKKFQEFVGHENRDKIGDLIYYPVDVRINHKEVRIKNKREFLYRYSEMFTKEVKDIIKNQTIRGLNVSDKGVMVGNGEVWINVIENKPGFWITAINN